MPEVGEVFQEVFFVEAKPPEANEIAAAQADAVKTIHLEQNSCVPCFLAPVVAARSQLLHTTVSHIASANHRAVQHQTKQQSQQQNERLTGGMPVFDQQPQ